MWIDLNKVRYWLFSYKHVKYICITYNTINKQHKSGSLFLLLTEN